VSPPPASPRLPSGSASGRAAAGRRLAVAQAWHLPGRAVRAFLALERRNRQRFYDGPAVFNRPGRRIAGYRSPIRLLLLWLRAWTVTWLSPAGQVFIGLMAFFVLVGAAEVLMPAYILAFVLVALFVVDFLFGWFFRPRLEVRRDLPRLVAAGQPATAAYRLHNRGRFAARRLQVDVVPAPDCRWPAGLVAIDELAPGATVRASSPFILPRRGRHELPLPVVSSFFPFGLWHWSARSTENTPVFAYPAYQPLDSLVLPPSGRAPRGQAILGAGLGDSTEFMTVREYRYGDNPRLIHALSWARRQEPVVKEFREEFVRRAALVLDLFLPPPGILAALRNRPEPRLEAALALAAAVAEALVRQNYLVDVFVPGGEPAHHEGQRGPGQLEGILEVIAGAAPVWNRTFHGPAPEPMLRLEEISTAVLILLDFDEPRQAFLGELQSLALGLKTIVVRPPGPEPGSRDDVVWLDPAQILAGRVREL